jgi:hypothetical protein
LSTRYPSHLGPLVTIAEPLRLEAGTGRVPSAISRHARRTTLDGDTPTSTRPARGSTLIRASRSRCAPAALGLFRCAMPHRPSLRFDLITVLCSMSTLSR